MCKSAELISPNMRTVSTMKWYVLPFFIATHYSFSHISNHIHELIQVSHEHKFEIDTVKPLTANHDYSTYITEHMSIYNVCLCLHLFVFVLC
jgi:hypothetical protein